MLACPQLRGTGVNHLYRQCGTKEDLIKYMYLCASVDTIFIRLLIMYTCNSAQPISTVQ